MLLFQHQKTSYNLHNIHSASLRNDGVTVNVKFNNGEQITPSVEEWQDIAIMLEGDGIPVPELLPNAGRTKEVETLKKK